MLDAVAVGNHRIGILTLIRHCLSRSSEPSAGEFDHRVGKGIQLTLSEMNLTIALGVLIAQRLTPHPQPSSVLVGVTCPDSTGVTMVTALVDSTLLGDDIGLNVITQTRRHQHLHCLHRHLDDVTIGQLAGSGVGIWICVEDVDRTTPSVTLLVWH